MSNKTFTQKEIEVLRTSPYVQNVSQSMVFFSASFKEQFWKMLCEGKAPRDIVIALGIDPDILGDNRIAGLKAIVKREVKAGKGFRDYITYTGGSSNYMSPEARIKYLEQQVEYKDQEIAFLKKNSISGQRGQGFLRIPPHAKYEIMYEMTKQNGNRLSISTLCEIAGVSRSGYYNYLSTEDVRLKREEQDRKDFQKILEAYNFRGYNKGARSIYMRLLHMDPPIHMNVKKIRRLMKKYGLFCPIRKANPYRRMAKAMATNNIAPNLVNREFEKHGPRKILLTDITYIINGKAPRVYMSTIIDAYTKEILSWVLSDSLVLDFVLDTVTQLCYTHDISLTEETIIHSDQGAHYTSIKFIELVKDKNLRQSMSRKANCWDNAPQESFFGHMKDEIDISQCTTFEEVCKVVSDWTDYYNNDRYQWDLAKLSPREFYLYCITGVYPLTIPKPKGKQQDR